MPGGRRCLLKQTSPKKSTNFMMGQWGIDKKGTKKKKKISTASVGKKKGEEGRRGEKKRGG